MSVYIAIFAGRKLDQAVNITHIDQTSRYKHQVVDFFEIFSTVQVEI